MDLDKAIAAHSQWRLTLRQALTNSEKLDVAKIGADNCCDLGRWLHGDAKTQCGALPAYKDVVTTHAAFHREAGQVAQKINAGEKNGAISALGQGTAYDAASANVVRAIGALKFALKQQKVA